MLYAVSQLKSWFKWLFGQLWGTLSTSPSFLSSKRLERLIFTLTVVIIVWIANIYNLGKWTSTDHMITLTPLLFAAGYNVIQERKDRNEVKNEKENPNTLE